MFWSSLLNRSAAVLKRPLAVMGLGEGELSLQDDGVQVAAENGAGVGVLRGQPADVGSALGERLDPGPLRRVAPQRQAARAERALQGAHGQAAVAAARDQRDAHLPGHERTAGVDAVGVAEIAQALLRPAGAVQHGAEIKGRVDGCLAGLFTGRRQRRQGRLDLAAAAETQPLPESRFGTGRLQGEDAAQEL